MYVVAVVMYIMCMSNNVNIVLVSYMSYCHCMLIRFNDFVEAWVKHNIYVGASDHFDLDACTS